MSNPAAATIESFVERRHRVASEVSISMKSAIPLVRRWSVDDAAHSTMDAVTRYLESIDPVEFNAIPTLFGSSVQGIVDVLEFLKARPLPFPPFSHWYGFVRLRNLQGTMTRDRFGLPNTFVDIQKAVDAALKAESVPALELLATSCNILPSIHEVVG